MERQKTSISLISIFLLWLILYSTTGCQKTFSKKNKANQFYVTVQTPESFNESNVLTLTYLNKEDEPFTDTLMKSEHFYTIKGDLQYPVKAFIEISGQRDFFPFILHSDSLTINLASNVNESAVLNSPLNKEWLALVKASEKSFKQISYLYPQIQKARLENNHKVLERIYREIEVVKEQQKQLLLDYVHSHPQSQLNAIILNDLYKNYPQDSLVLKNQAVLLQDSQKKGLINDLLSP